MPEQGAHISPNDDFGGEEPDCYVAGWGHTGRQSDVLQSVDVNIYSTEYCHNMSRYGDTFDPEVEFCAGKIEGRDENDAHQKLNFN